MSDKFEVSRSSARLILEHAKEALLEAEERAFAANEEVAELKSTIGELTAKLTGLDLPKVNNSGKPRQRLPKGYGEEAVAKLLGELPPGDGLTMAEISKRTGINNSTIFRVLSVPARNKGRFVERDGQWSLKISGVKVPVRKVVIVPDVSSE